MFRLRSVMSRALIETAKLAVNLTTRPIEPSWIIEGNPVAEWCVLSKSADGLAFTVVWECTEGKFNWYYDFDETILILEGSIVLENDTMKPTRYPPADVVRFRVAGIQQAQAYPAAVRKAADGEPRLRLDSKRARTGIIQASACKNPSPSWKTTRSSRPRCRARRCA